MSNATVSEVYSPSHGKKSQIKVYVEDLGCLYAHCFDVATEKLSEKATEEETIRACASSLFIAATRKFGM